MNSFIWRIASSYQRGGITELSTSNKAPHPTFELSSEFISRVYFWGLLRRCIYWDVVSATFGHRSTWIYYGEILFSWSAMLFSRTSSRLSPPIESFSTRVFSIIGSPHCIQECNCSNARSETSSISPHPCYHIFFGFIICSLTWQRHPASN